MQNTCAEIKLRAERRAGERLEEQGRGQEGRPENSDTMSPLEEADVVEDTLWAIGVLNRREDARITEGEIDWPCMQGVLFGAERGV